MGGSQSHEFAESLSAGNVEEVKKILSNNKDKEKLISLLKSKSEPFDRTPLQRAAADSPSGQTATFLVLLLDTILSIGGPEFLQSQLMLEKDMSGRDVLMLLCSSTRDCSVETLKIIFDASVNAAGGKPFLRRLLFTNKTLREGETAFQLLCKNTFLNAGTFTFFVATLKEACDGDATLMTEQFSATTTTGRFSLFQQFCMGPSCSEELLKLFIESFEENCCSPSSSSSVAPGKIIKEHLIDPRNVLGASSFMSFCSNSYRCVPKSLSIFINLIIKAGGNELLLEQLNMKTFRGYTAFMFACQHSSSDAVVALLEVIKGQKTSSPVKFLRSQLLESKTSNDCVEGMSPLMLLCANPLTRATTLQSFLGTIKNDCLVSDLRDEEARTLLKEQLEQKSSRSETSFSLLAGILRTGDDVEMEKFKLIQEELLNLGLFEDQFLTLPQQKQAFLKEKKFVDW